MADYRDLDPVLVFVNRSGFEELNIALDVLNSLKEREIPFNPETREIRNAIDDTGEALTNLREEADSYLRQFPHNVGLKYYGRVRDVELEKLQYLTQFHGKYVFFKYNPQKRFEFNNYRMNIFKENGQTIISFTEKSECNSFKSVIDMYDLEPFQNGRVSSHYHYLMRTTFDDRRMTFQDLANSIEGPVVCLGNGITGPLAEIFGWMCTNRKEKSPVTVYCYGTVSRVL
jgi:hypothetical protein